VSYEYDRLGRRESMKSGNLEVNYTYNTKGLTSVISYANPYDFSLETFRFYYDDIGRLASIDNLNNKTSASYTYNTTTQELDKIEHFYNGTGSESIAYKYDQLGMVNSLDRTGMEVLMPAVTNAVYDPQNRMVRFNGITINYDANGNPLHYKGMDLTWNQKGQLTSVTGAPAGPISYKYDAMGKRVAKTVNGVTTKYLYDGNNLVAEIDGSNNVTAWYVHAGLDRPLARVDASDGSVLYYHQDLLGSVIALTNSSGVVVTQYNYSPFGHTEVIGIDIDQPFRFTGREYDSETGLYYYRARYYSPDMKRFISEDPLRFAAGDVNWYAYVGSNPVNFTDPLGLESYTDGAFAGVPDPIFNSSECLYGLSMTIMPASLFAGPVAAFSGVSNTFTSMMTGISLGASTISVVNNPNGDTAASAGMDAMGAAAVSFLPKSTHPVSAGVATTVIIFNMLRVGDNSYSYDMCDACGP